MIKAIFVRKKENRNKLTELLKEDWFQESLVFCLARHAETAPTQAHITGASMFIDTMKDMCADDEDNEMPDIGLNHLTIKP